MSAGTFANIHSPQARFPWVDVVADSGKFVGVILAEPEKYEGKVLAASSCIHSMEEVVQILSKVSGKTVRYVEMPEAKFREVLSPGWRGWHCEYVLVYSALWVLWCGHGKSGGIHFASFPNPPPLSTHPITDSPPETPSPC